MATFSALASDFLRGIAVLILIPIAFTFLAGAFKLLHVYRTDRTEYLRNQMRATTPLAVMRGETNSFYDGVRDERVSAGIAIDGRNNRWVEQGKLSEEAVSAVLS